MAKKIDTPLGEVMLDRKYIPKKIADDLGDTSEWREITWADCTECGGDFIVGPGDVDEKLYDGDSLVCVDCGDHYGMQADSEGWSVMSLGDKVNADDLKRLRVQFEYTDG